MKKLIVLAVAAMFTFAVSAQSQTSVPVQTPGKTDKPAKMDKAPKVDKPYPGPDKTVKAVKMDEKTNASIEGKPKVRNYGGKKVKPIKTTKPKMDKDKMKSDNPTKMEKPAEKK